MRLRELHSNSRKFAVMEVSIGKVTVWKIQTTPPPVVLPARHCRTKVATVLYSSCGTCTHSKHRAKRAMCKCNPVTPSTDRPLSKHDNRSALLLNFILFTPLISFPAFQVQKCELDMISKLQFRLAPPSADETLHCLATLVHNLWPVTVPLADIISVASCYLKKARARTCWFRHSPYTLAVAALATAFNNLGLGQRKRRLLRECDARARSITGRGVDFHGVAACAAAMSGDERAAAAAAAAARAVRGSTESPVCGKAAKEGWGSPTGVAQGAELLQEAAFSTVGGAVPLVEDLAPSSRTAALPSPQAFSPRMHAPRRVARGAAPVARPPLPAAAAPIAARACSSAVRKRRLSAPASVGGGFPETEGLGSRAPGAETGSRRTVQKRGLHQSYGSCFVPCARRQCLEGSAGRRVSVGAYADSGHATTTGAQSQGKVGRVDEGRGDGSSNTCVSYQDA